MSLSKNDIKLIRSLSQKKFREQYSLFVLEGQKLVEEAIRSGIIIEKTVIREEVGVEVMERISTLSSPPPILAVAQKPPLLPFEAPKEGSLYLALESIKDPGNLGTIIRLAEWFGVEAIYLSPDCVEPFNPKVVQSAMGSLFRVKYYTIELKELTTLSGKRVNHYGTTLDGANIYEQNLSAGGVIYLGSESHGLSQPLLSKLSHKLTIPSFDRSGQIDSLNVAVAAAVVCSQFKSFAFDVEPQIKQQ